MKSPLGSYLGSYHCRLKRLGGVEPELLVDHTFQALRSFVLMFQAGSELSHLSAKPPLAQPRSASLA